MVGKQVRYDDEDGGRERTSRRHGHSRTRVPLSYHSRFATEAAAGEDVQTVDGSTIDGGSCALSTTIAGISPTVSSRSGPTDTKAESPPVSSANKMKEFAHPFMTFHYGERNNDADMMMVKAEADQNGVYNHYGGYHRNELSYDGHPYDELFHRHHQEHLEIQTTTGGSITDERLLASRATATSDGTSTSRNSGTSETIRERSTLTSPNKQKSVIGPVMITHCEQADHDSNMSTMTKEAGKNVLQINNFVYEEGQDEEFTRCRDRHHKIMRPDAVKRSDNGEENTFVLAPRQRYRREQDNSFMNFEAENTSTSLQVSPPRRVNSDDSLPQPGAVHVAGILSSTVVHDDEATVVYDMGTPRRGGIRSMLEAEPAPNDDDVVDRVMERFQHIITGWIRPTNNQNAPIAAQPLSEEEIQRIYNNNNTTFPWKTRIYLSSFMCLILVGLAVVCALFVGSKKDPSSGYCNWNNCDGEPQGGDFCNMNKLHCESDCYSVGVLWCEGSGSVNENKSANTDFFLNGYCNWSNCNGEAQGGDHCNQNKNACEVDCYSFGVKWCENNGAKQNATSDWNAYSYETTAAPSSELFPNGYCNWNNCNGEAQGGDECNHNKSSCLVACYSYGVKWCEGSATTVETVGTSSSPYCGDGKVGNSICEDGTCCSQHGYCGTTQAYCGSSQSSTRLNGNRTLLFQNTNAGA